MVRRRDEAGNDDMEPHVKIKLQYGISFESISLSCVYSLSDLRVVCDRARPRADAKCPSDDLLQTFGERGAPDRH